MLFKNDKSVDGNIFNFIVVGFSITRTPLKEISNTANAPVLENTALDQITAEGKYFFYIYC